MGNPPKKSIEEELSEIDNSKRLNRIAARRYRTVAKQKEKASGNAERLAKIEKRTGYDYETADKYNIKPDETGHYPSVGDGGEILKGPRHPTIKKTIKTERALGNKVFKVDGKMYTAPKTEAKDYRRALKNKQ